MRLSEYRVTLWLGFAVMVILVVLVGGTVKNLHDLNLAQNKLEQLLANITEKTAAAASMQDMFQDTQVYLRDILLLHDKQEAQDVIKKMRHAREIYDEHEAGLNQLFTDKDDRALLEQAVMMRSSSRPVVDRVIDKAVKGDTQEAENLFLKQVLPLYGERRAAMDALIKLQVQKSKEMASSISLAHRESRTMIYALGAISLIMAVLMGGVIVTFGMMMDYDRRYNARGGVSPPDKLLK